jgi:mono/diheme cytochrome c family protein
MPISKPWVTLALSAALGGLWWVADMQDGYADTAPTDPVLARGGQIARQICSVCHVVAGDQKFPPLLRSREPSFREIANRPTTTQASIQKFITTTHWDEKTIPMTMPDPMLKPEEAVAVSRYILSLRTK